MTLITGGAYSGKTDYVIAKFGLENSDIIDGGNCSLQDISSCQAIKNFQLLVKRFGTENGTALAEMIYKSNPDIIVISNDIGSGIIPMEKADRLWREEVGRACCKIAEYSDIVIRICCGIPSVIKGKIS